MYKANTKMSSINIRRWFNLDHVAKQFNNLRHRYTRTSLKATCVSVYGVTPWNLIQQEIKNAINIHTFKKECKKLLLQKYKLAQEYKCDSSNVTTSNVCE